MSNSLEMILCLKSSWLVPKPQMVLFFWLLCVKPSPLAPSLIFLNTGLMLLLQLEIILSKEGIRANSGSLRSLAPEVRDSSYPIVTKMTESV